MKNSWEVLIYKKWDNLHLKLLLTLSWFLLDFYISTRAALSLKTPSYWVQRIVRKNFGLWKIEHYILALLKRLLARWHLNWASRNYRQFWPIFDGSYFFIFWAMKLLTKPNEILVKITMLLCRRATWMTIFNSDLIQILVVLKNFVNSNHWFDRFHD